MTDQRELLDFAVAWAQRQLSLILDWALAGYAVVIAMAREQLALTGVAMSEKTVALIIWAAAAVTVLALVRMLRLFMRRGSKEPPTALAAAIRTSRRLGLVATMLFIVVFGGWSVLAPLASAALAPGVISLDGHRKTIQHLEGGIIRTIHVREGDTVNAGDPLITLSDTKAKALEAEIRERLLHVLATEARLEAERVGAPEISFPPFLLQEDSPELQQVMNGQRQLFNSRRAAQEGRAQILGARIRQLEEQNAGLKEVITAEDQQIALIEEEMSSAKRLLDEGLERRPRVLALKRGHAELTAEKATNRAKIAENAQEIGETRLQLLTIAEERQEKIATELADIRRVLAELRGQLPSREDILERTVIRAPIAGRVMGLQVTTESGVVKPGQPLLDIVPDGSAMVIDARVRPTDIERIRPGMTARVILTAYRQRSLPQIHGTLRSISADALADERTGTPYFLAKVEISPKELAAMHGEVQLLPGMPAEVMLMDGEQSLFKYLLAPILDSGRRSLREN